MNSHVSATIGIKAVDWRQLADDNFRQRMGNFDRICKQIDEKHDHVMEMLANIQEQLRVLEMNRRKGSRVDFGVANAQSQFQFSSLDQRPKPAPKGENEGISNIEVVTGSATISKTSNDTKLENEEYVELLKYVPSIVTVAMEAYYSTTKATEIQEQRVFDEMPESEKSKISDILPPLILGSEIDEVCDFSVSNPQFQMPLECLSLISSPSSFGFSLDDTKLEDEGLVDVPIHTSVAELQLQESESEFEWSQNSPDLSLPEFIPSWRIMEWVHCMSWYVMNFTCLAFAYDPGICCMCWNDSLVYVPKIQLDNLATSNHQIGLYGVKLVKNASIFHYSLANPTMELEDTMPLQEISSLLTVCCPTKHITSRAIRYKDRKKRNNDARWFLMAFSNNLHYFEVFFKPNKLHLLKCVMNNDGHSWSVKVLNSSEKEAVELWQILDVLDDIFSEQLEAKVKEYGITAPYTKKGFSDPYPLNLMFWISIEPLGASPAYTCLETQVVQIGQAFRNEISHRQVLLRVSEFTLVEFEHFMGPDVKSHIKFVEVVKLEFYMFPREYHVSRQQARKIVIIEAVFQSIATLGYFIGGVYLFFTLLGMDKHRLWFHQQGNEMANYDADCWGVEIECSHGWIECVGIADRSTSDLQAHTYKSDVFGFKEFHSNFRSIQVALSLKKVGGAFEGLGVDQLLTVLLWISLENGHMIQNFLAGNELILVPMGKRPSRKPPFQCRQMSLGDKTLSTGEYCHALGQSDIWGFTSASYSIPRSCIFT